MTAAATPMQIVICGLSITSSWGNGHATTYRGLVRELTRRGHDVLFLERDVPWYRDNRDLPSSPFGRTALYDSLGELRSRWTEAVREADLVIVGSYVPDGAEVGEWVLATSQGVRAFYDIDTPVTLARLARGDYEYLTPSLVSRYELYLSFTGGPTLQRLEQEFGSPMARALYCSVDPELYFPEERECRWSLAYMGTYSDDRQATVDRLLLEPARRSPSLRFAVAGPQYPDTIAWPANVERMEHLPPAQHRAFYSRQRYALNVTRAEMIAAGWSPSVRLFEAAACGTPIISDRWPGIEELLLPEKELLLASSTEEVLEMLHDISEEERRAIGSLARERVLRQHTSAARAIELESYVQSLLSRTASA